MKFNIDEFKRIAARVYPQPTEWYKCPYSFDEVMDVFAYFFEAYEDYRGEVHPPINANQIFDIIDKMPVVDDIDVSPEMYKEMIERYFQSSFQNRCNYRINHFFSGDVRKYRLYELAYI